MKKSVLKNLVAYFNNETVDTDALKKEIFDEYDRLNEKSRANAEKYAAAKDIVLNAIVDKPMTAKEIFTACETELPQDFTSNKIQYALLHYWNDDVVRHIDGKNPSTYQKKS